MSAVYKSGLTKLGNQTASKMSMGVMGKGVISGVTSDIPLSFTMGIKDILGSGFNTYNQQSLAVDEPIYWCPPEQKGLW